MTLLASAADLPVPYFSDVDRRARVLDACPALEPIFQRHADERRMSGLYGVLLDGELIYEGSFGVANLSQVQRWTPIPFFASLQ